MKIITAKQLKKQFELTQDEPLPDGIKVTCLCGNCPRVKLTNEDFEKMAEMLNNIDFNEPDYRTIV